jgi:uncharacterized protein YuzE
MRITYDREVDALSIIFSDKTVTTRELAEGIAPEYDRDGLAGLEVLEVSKRLGGARSLEQIILEGVRSSTL